MPVMGHAGREQILILLHTKDSIYTESTFNIFKQKRDESSVRFSNMISFNLVTLMYQ